MKTLEGQLFVQTIAPCVQQLPPQCFWVSFEISVFGFPLNGYNSEHHQKQGFSEEERGETSRRGHLIFEQVTSDSRSKRADKPEFLGRVTKKSCLKLEL